MTEKQFENKIKKFLESRGVVQAGTPVQNRPDKVTGWYVKIWGGGFQRPGIPDLLINVKGRFIGLEVKAKNGVASSIQQLNIDLINQAGGIGLILYPKDYKKFKKTIDNIINE